MWIWPIYRMSWIIWCISWGWKVAPAVITKLNKSFNFPCVHHTCNTDCTGGRSLELATLACSSASYNPLKQTRKAHDTNYSQILQNRPPRECANLQHFLCQHWDVCLLNKIDCTFEDDKKAHSPQRPAFKFCGGSGDLNWWTRQAHDLTGRPDRASPMEGLSENRAPPKLMVSSNDAHQLTFYLAEFLTCIRASCDILSDIYSEILQYLTY